MDNSPHSNPEVTPKPDRRQFTADYKRRIVREANACTRPGEVGALLRREGLYSSHLTSWRQALKAAEDTALSPHKRGPKVALDPRDTEVARLRQEVERLKGRLERAEVIIDVQKKLSGLLGMPLDQQPEETK